MLKALQTHFNMSEIEAKKFVGNDEYAAAAKVLSWTEDTCPRVSYWMKLSRSPYVRDSFVRAGLITKISDWTKKWCTEKAVDQCSSFEFTVVLERNPFYWWHAFNVSVKACLDFARRYKSPITNEARAYLVACQAIKEGNRSLTKDEMCEVLKKEGLATYLDTLSFLRPFGSDVLCDHVFENVDLDVISPGVAIATMTKRKWTGLSCVREKRSLTNNLVQREDGSWRIKDEITTFVDAVEALNVEV